MLSCCSGERGSDSHPRLNIVPPATINNDNKARFMVELLSREATVKATRRADIPLNWFQLNVRPFAG
jgi:hypothetical protein